MTDFSILRSLSCRLVELGAQRREIAKELESLGYGHVPAWVRADALRFADSLGRGVALERYWDEYAKERLSGLAGPVNVRRGVFPAAAAYRSDFLDELRQADVFIEKEGGLRYTSSYFEPSLREWSNQNIGATLERHVQQMQLVQRNAADENSRRGNVLMHDALVSISHENFLRGLSMTLEGFSVVGGGPVFGRGLWIDIPQSPWRMTLHDLSHRTINGGFLQFSFGISHTKFGNFGRKIRGFDASFRANDLIPFWNYNFNRFYIREFHYAIEEIACLTMIIFKRLQKILAN